MFCNFVCHHFVLQFRLSNFFYFRVKSLSKTVFGLAQYLSINIICSAKWHSWTTAHCMYSRFAKFHLTLTSSAWFCLQINIKWKGDYYPKINERKIVIKTSPPPCTRHENEPKASCRLPRNRLEREDGTLCCYISEDYPASGTSCRKASSRSVSSGKEMPAPHLRLRQKSSRLMSNKK